jgi:hypothetical protein
MKSGQAPELHLEEGRLILLRVRGCTLLCAKEQHRQQPDCMAAAAAAAAAAAYQHQ